MVLGGKTEGINTHWWITLVSGVWLWQAYHTWLKLRKSACNVAVHHITATVQVCFVWGSQCCHRLQGREQNGEQIDVEGTRGPKSGLCTEPSTLPAIIFWASYGSMYPSFSATFSSPAWLPATCVASKGSA